MLRSYTMGGATLARDDSRMLSGLHQSIGLVDTLTKQGGDTSRPKNGTRTAGRLSSCGAGSRKTSTDSGSSSASHG